MRTYRSRWSSAAESIPRSETRRSSMSSSALSWERSWKRCSPSSRAVPSTYSASSAVSGEDGERGRQALEEAALGGRQRRVGQARAQRAGADVAADHRLVEVGRRPVREPGVDRPVVREDALGDAARRGDDHDHEDLRLEHQDLDVADRRRLDRRRGDDGEQVGDLRERLGGHAHRLVDLAAGERQRHAARRARSPSPPARAGCGRRSSGSRRRSARGRRTCAGGRAAPAPRAPPARCGSSTGRR